MILTKGTVNTRLFLISHIGTKHPACRAFLNFVKWDLYNLKSFLDIYELSVVALLREHIAHKN